MNAWPGLVVAPLVSVIAVLAADASDWARFRGPNGSGVSADSESLPVEWGDQKNLKWKANLPGPGSSSPIVVGDKVFLTCWSGYADGTADSKLEQLKRHLVCLDRATGNELWKSSVDVQLPEESYQGMFAENGYASHTPVSDGKHVFAFFGKAGVKAYDFEGSLLWETMVGDDLDDRGWGTASSPILYKNLVIVTASVEDRAIVALDASTGKEVWKQQADGLASTWGTPILVSSQDATDLVIGVPYEIWGLNPETGKLRWFCEAIDSNSMCSSVTAAGDIIYGMESGPGGGGAVAVKAGGKGDVTKSNIQWTGSERSRIGTPVVHDGLIYWVTSGVANCIDAKTGERVYQGRLTGSLASPAARGAAGTEQKSGEGPGDGGGGRGGRGGRGGGQDYSSPVIADGKMFYTQRSGFVHVVKLGREFEVLGVNRFESSEGDFHATPAISNGQLFIRSSKTLYCVQNESGR